MLQLLLLRELLINSVQRYSGRNNNLKNKKNEKDTIFKNSPIAIVNSAVKLVPERHDV
jgi:hypothetical protein